MEVTTLPPNASNAEYEAAFDHLLAETRRIQEKVDQDRIKYLQREIRELRITTRKELDQLHLAIHRLEHELQRIRENEAHEREKMELRFEIQKLRAAQSLPASQAEPSLSEAVD